MMQHPYITGTLLGLAVIICFLCSIGVLVMRDAYQRMHFSTPVVSLAVLLITVAIWIEDPTWQARIKAVLVSLILFLMNSILSHATARAIRLRQVGHWPVAAEEKIPVVNEEGKKVAIAGQKNK